LKGGNTSINTEKRNTNIMKKKKEKSDLNAHGIKPWI